MLNSQYTMNPILMCDSYRCNWMEELTQSVNAPNVGGKLKCPECSRPVMLCSYRIVRDEISLNDIAEQGFNEASRKLWDG